MIEQKIQGLSRPKGPINKKKFKNEYIIKERI